MAGKRPWLAALLGAVATGLGHLYLRRWLRALGWIALATVTADLFVPAAAMTRVQSYALATVTGGSTPAPPTTGTFIALAPLLMVSVLSIADAYFMAVLVNRQQAIVDHRRCPACGHDLDEDLDFCQWCSEPLASIPADDDALDSY